MGVKSNVRSFRYSDEVAGVLEAYPGHNLNEKFENLVLNYFWNKGKMEKDMDAQRRKYNDLCKEVEAKKVELLEIGRLLEEKQRLIDAIALLASDLISYQERTQEVTQKLSDAAAMGE